MEDEDKQSFKRSSFLLVPKHPSGKIFCYNDPLLGFLKFKTQHDLHLLKKNKGGWGGNREHTFSKGRGRVNVLGLMAIWSLS